MELESPASKTKRIAWIDLAKSFAIIGVLVDHTNRILYSNQVVAYASYYSVSLFIIVMGITTYRSLTNKNRSVLKYLQRRTIQMIVPYTIATIICCSAYSKRFIFQDIIQHLLHFNGCLPYYYVILYLQLLWISPIVFRLTCKANTACKKIAVTIAVVAISVLSTNKSDILSIYGGGGKLFGGTYLFLLYLGMLIAKNYDLIHKMRGGGILNTLILCSVGLAFSIAWCLWISRDQLNLDRAIRYFGGFNPPGISFIIYAILVAFTLFFVEELFEKANIEEFLAPLMYVGRNTLPIFLYHILFRDCALKVTSAYGVSQNMWIQRIIVFPAMILGPLILNMIINYTVKYVSKTYHDCNI